MEADSPKAWAQKSWKPHLTTILLAKTIRVHLGSTGEEIDFTSWQGHIATEDVGSEMSVAAIVRNILYHLWKGKYKEKAAIGSLEEMSTEVGLETD